MAPTCPWAAGGNGSGNGVGDGAGDGSGSGTVWVGADWICKPAREVPYHWPRAKAVRKTSAAVLLDCVMPKPGKPDHCSVASERPQGCASARQRWASRATSAFARRRATVG